MNKKDLAILLGNIIDHFDRSLYVFLAPIIAPLFFPSSDPIFSLILAYLVLGGELISKPLGTYLFANITRSKGPGAALSYSLIGLGIFTGLIGFLPEYSHIGLIAPLSLAIMRILGGVFAAGESVVAELYIIEGKDGAPAIKRSYLYQSSTIIGIILASIAATIVFHFGYDHLWRLPFLLGAKAALMGYFFRIYLFNDEKNNYQQVEERQNLIANLKLLYAQKLALFKIILVQNISQISYAMPFVVMNYFVPLISNVSVESMMIANNFMLIFDLIMLFVIGHLSTSFKPSAIMRYSSFILMISIIPLWYFIENSTIFYVSFVRFWVVIVGIIFLCPLSVWCRDQLSGSRDQYLIVGIGSSISSVLAGKLTPSICLLLYYLTGSYMSISVYFFIIFGSAWWVLTKSN